MNNMQTIGSYSELAELSGKGKKPLIVSLETGDYESLMCEVVESLQNENTRAFELVKVSGKIAKQIQQELNILKLPAIILLYEANIKAIFQGLVAKHEILNILNKIN